MTTKLKKNLFYNITYQLFNIALPLITVPYISRTLGVESNGIYSYTYSIVNYFMIFAMLGISNYGNRRIAKKRDNKKYLSSEFISIYIVQAALSTLSIFTYILYSIFIAEYKTISFIEILFLLSTLLDISWLYFGLEDFKTTVLRNGIIKALSVILILIFIHNSNDTNTYTIIMSASTLLSQIILWIGVKKHIDISFTEITLRKVTSHFKGIIILFIPVISYSVYKIMDKIMLGAMYSIDEVAFYEYAEKVINIPIGIVTAIGTVMLPKASNLIEKQNKQQAQKYLYKSLEIVCFMSIPCCLGLIVVANSLSTLFLGEEYARTGIIMQFLAITFLFTAWANIIRTQWLIPNEKDSIYVTTTIIGALINLIINLLLIPQYGGVGAAIGTIASEFWIMSSQSFLVRKDFTLKPILNSLIHFTITGGIMFAIVALIEGFVQNKVFCIISQILAGTALYLILNFNYLTKYLKIK